MKRKIYLILATAIFILIGLFGYFHFSQPQAEEEFTGDFGSENNHYRNTETKNLSPYAIFGDSSFVLMTEAERTGKHTLDISSTLRQSKIGKIQLDMRTGVLKIVDKKGNLISQEILKPEVLARFLSVDRLAHKYTALSPYNYVANNPIRNIDPNGDSIFVTNGDEKVLYTPGGSYNGNNKFILSVFSYLDVLNQTSGGATILEHLTGTSNHFKINSEYPTVDGVTQTDALSFSRFASGGGLLRAGRLLSESSSASQNFKSIAHELFHAYQSEFGEIGRESYVEVSAYLFGAGMQFQAMGSEINGDMILFSQSWGHDINSSGVVYDNAMNSLFEGSFNQNVFNQATTNFINGSNVNFDKRGNPGQGVYKDFGKNTKNNPVISQFYPLRGF